MAAPILLTSVPAQTPYIQYVATSGQTVFPYPFEITQDQDLVCIVNGNTLPTDVGYTLSGQGNDTGGNLTFTLGRTGGDVVTIYRNITIARATQIPQNGTFFSSTYNNEYNRIYLIMQQLEESIGFSLQIPFTNNPAPTTELTPAQYANMYLSFDAYGNPQPAALVSGTLTAAILGQLLYPQSAAEALAGVTPTNLYIPWNWVTRYGAVPVSTAAPTTDSYAAFATAAAVAVYSGRIHIPSASPFYYRLDTSWVLTGLPPGTVIDGDGLSSIVVPANAIAADGIVNNGNLHLCFKDFGVYGTSGIGNNINNINSAHYPDHINVWSGFAPATYACFKTTLGICARYDHCQADDNSAFRPITLIGGLTEGHPGYGFWIPSTVTGNNNNPTFTACRANAVGGVCNVVIGTSGQLPVSTFHWFGGLIQGSSVYTEFYLTTQDSGIFGAHIEPIPGNTIGWIGTFDGCINTAVIGPSTIEGDVRMINGCQNCGFEKLTQCGVLIDDTCTYCYVRDSSYYNISTGPAGGQIQDAGFGTDLRNLQGGPNANVTVGNNLRNPTVYF